MSIPKPSLKEVDETSITLNAADLNTNSGDMIKIQYKVPQKPWSEAKEVDVQTMSDNSMKVSTSSLIDLEPGTPYMIRYVIYRGGGDKIEGPETVFDTKPINCTPKQKKSCTIS